MIKAGPRDRRITIERVSPEAYDAAGQLIETWTPLATVWASAMPVKDGERFGNQEAIATITHRFQVLWAQALWDTVDPRCRVLFDGRYHDVVAVKEIGRREGIEISATARAERI